MLITHLCLCLAKSSPRASGQYQQFCAEIGRIEERMRALVAEAPPLLPSSPPRAPCKDTSMAGGPSRLSAVRTRKSSGCASRKSIREHALPFGPAHDSILSSFMPTCRYRALSAECARTRVTRYPTDHASDRRSKYVTLWLSPCSGSAVVFAMATRHVMIGHLYPCPHLRLEKPLHSAKWQATAASHIKRWC